MTRLCSCVLSLLLAAPVAAQLRPRRVGTSALGEQEVPMPTGGDDLSGGGLGGNMGAGLAGMEGLEAMANAFGGEGGFDPAALLQGMDLENNPMLQGLANANPELAQLLSNPEALQEQMAKMAEMMQSGEGQELAQKMMSEMQSVLTDPEKLREGLEQLNTNPMLKGLADAVPGLKDVLNDPEQLELQAAKTAELFQSMSDPAKAQEMLASLGASGEGAAEGLQALQEALGGLANGDGGDFAETQRKLLQALQGVGGGGGDDDLLGGGGEGADGDLLKARVREQLAAMMNGGGGGGGGMGLDAEDEVF
jgi:hypothetical protein